MKTSHAGVVAITLREEMVLTAYLDGGGVWTIGIGHTAAAGEPIPRPGMTITRAEATALFAHDLLKYEKTVNDCIHVPVTQNQFDAMVSLCYNIGQDHKKGFPASSVVRLVNQGDMKGAAKAFLLWNKDNGRVVRGLVNRRNSEMQQFLTPDAKPLGATPAAPAPETGFWAWLKSVFTRK